MQPEDVRRSPIDKLSMVSKILFDRRVVEMRQVIEHQASQLQALHLEYLASLAVYGGARLSIIFLIGISQKEAAQRTAKDHSYITVNWERQEMLVNDETIVTGVKKSTVLAMGDSPAGTDFISFMNKVDSYTDLKTLLFECDEVHIFVADDDRPTEDVPAERGDVILINKRDGEGKPGLDFAKLRDESGLPEEVLE